jgi:hypothetical protein
MQIHQLSLFIENRPGQLSLPVKLLADAGIDIRTLALAETKDYGILRLIVADWPRAKQVLEQGGCVVKVTEVLAIEVPDRPGGLRDVLTILDRAHLNIEYMYAFTAGRADKAVLIFRFDRPEVAITALQAEGVTVVVDDEIRARYGEAAR